jgi:putative OPT family oligopeptide transporter
MSESAFTKPQQQLPEITWKVIFLSLLLTILLAMSNTYLALKVGILASASIPAAIISMGVLRWFKNANILENNLVQTAASAGEAVAGGVVYTMPALILIHYWQHFNYWVNFGIAFLGGILGVLFSVPLRRVLVTEKTLPFPEGRAIAEVLMAESQQQLGIRAIAWGGLIGALLELMQEGLKVIADAVHVWVVSSSKITFGFAAGFSPTMIGVGYIIGFRVAVSIILGAVVAWGFGVPVVSYFVSMPEQSASVTDGVMLLWGSNIRYIGVGAMLLAGIWTLLTLSGSFARSLVDTVQGFQWQHLHYAKTMPRTEQDIPFLYVCVMTVLLLVVMLFFFWHIMPLSALAITSAWQIVIVLGSILYVVFIGFLFSGICGYFSGLVGVTASPGSAVIIAGLLVAAFLLRLLLEGHASLHLPSTQLAAAATVIFLGAMIQSIAAIANDNIQDLKVGYIVGATPWKQQLMLMFGVLIAAAVIPLVMELLFNVYGMGDVMPRDSMDLSKALPAPPAAMMAAITQGVLNYDLPWAMLGIGMAIIVFMIILNCLLPLRLSVLGIAIGMYLPLTTSVALFIGGFLAFLTKKGLQQCQPLFSSAEYEQRRHVGVLLACGLIAGAALMNILMAIPFMLSQNPELLRIMPSAWSWLASLLALISTTLLLRWMYQQVCQIKTIK